MEIATPQTMKKSIPKTTKLRSTTMSHLYLPNLLRVKKIRKLGLEVLREVPATSSRMSSAGRVNTVNLLKDGSLGRAGAQTGEGHRE